MLIVMNHFFGVNQQLALHWPLQFVSYMQYGCLFFSCTVGLCHSRSYQGKLNHLPLTWRTVSQVNIQPKSRNVTAGSGKSGEGSTNVLLLPYKMQRQCFALIQHSHCVLICRHPAESMNENNCSVEFRLFCVLLFTADMTTPTPDSLVPNLTHSHLVILFTCIFVMQTNQEKKKHSSLKVHRETSRQIYMKLILTESFLTLFMLLFYLPEQPLFSTS